MGRRPPWARRGGGEGRRRHAGCVSTYVRATWTTLASVGQAAVSQKHAWRGASPLPPCPACLASTPKDDALAAAVARRGACACRGREEGARGKTAQQKGGEGSRANVPRRAAGGHTHPSPLARAQPLPSARHVRRARARGCRGFRRNRHECSTASPRRSGGRRGCCGRAGRQRRQRRDEGARHRGGEPHESSWVRGRARSRATAKCPSPITQPAGIGNLSSRFGDDTPSEWVPLRRTRKAR